IMATSGRILPLIGSAWTAVIAMRSPRASVALRSNNLHNTMRPVAAKATPARKLTVLRRRFVKVLRACLPLLLLLCVIPAWARADAPVGEPVPSLRSLWEDSHAEVPVEPARVMDFIRQLERGE